MSALEAARIVFLGSLALSNVLQLLIGWCAYDAVLPVPAEFREIQPALSHSCRRWFSARGISSQDDC